MTGLAIAVFSSVRRSAALLAGLLVPFPVSCDGAAERFCEEHRPRFFVISHRVKTSLSVGKRSSVKAERADTAVKESS